MRLTACMLVIFTFCLAAGPSAASGILIVPQGNRHVEQPGVPGASVRRTKAGRT
ncbi:DUF1402 family protein, partial [Sinorhizobium meliloti]